MSAPGVSRVIVAHNPVGPQDDPSTADVLEQVELVAAGLTALGIPHRRVAVPAGQPWQVLPPAAKEADGLVVWNFVESPPGAPWLHTNTTAALELLGHTFTGSSAAVLGLTTDKIATRALLAAHGLPVAPGGRLDPAAPEILDRIPGPWILKPNCEDASIGLDGNPVCATREAALARAADLLRRFPGQAVLAETFLPGREVNVGLLPRTDGSFEVLPPAEMLFVDFPPDMPRVLGYEAKWAENTFAYEQTVRRFLDPGADAADAALIERVSQLAREALRATGVTGYCRVDFRLDAAGVPCILEINANPCLAPGAGFMAAAERAGLSTAQVVERILATARRPSTAQGAEATVRAPAPPAPPTPPDTEVRLRADLVPGDRQAIAELVRATGFFNPEEEAVAAELVDDRLAHGAASHYQFLVAESDVEGRDAVVGYACWGSIPGTRESADLYWIAVHPRCQGKRVGATLLAAAEARMAADGRHRIYVETSTRAQYEPTRAFYRACGYHLAAELADFYAPGDGKAMFVKVVGGGA